MKARPLNPMKMKMDTATRMRNGFQISTSLNAAMNKSSAGLVHRTTAGNAFYVRQIVRSMVDRGDIFRFDGDWQSRAGEEIVLPLQHQRRQPLLARRQLLEAFLDAQGETCRHGGQDAARAECCLPGDRRHASA